MDLLDKEHSLLENSSRRKVVKNIIVATGAWAAYNCFPTKWNVPIIEQVFLPAHAATSGISLHDPCSLTVDSVTFLVDGYVTPPTEGLAVEIVATQTGGGGFNQVDTVNTITAADGTFSGIFGIYTSNTTDIAVVTTVAGASGSASCSQGGIIPVPAG